MTVKESEHLNEAATEFNAAARIKPILAVLEH